jgi:hypothetical protein
VCWNDFSFYFLDFSLISPHSQDFPQFSLE